MKKLKPLGIVAAFALALSLAPSTFADEIKINTDNGTVTTTTDGTTTTTTVDEITTAAGEAAANISFEDIFQYSDSLTSSSTIDSSAFFSGLSLDDTSTINGIGWFAGNNVKLKGTYDYGVAVGSTIDASGIYENDAFLAGSTVTINKDATIGRSVYAAGGVVKLQASVPGSAYIAGSTVEIGDGVTIDGNLNLDAESVTFGNNVTIKGTVNYNSDAKVNNLNAVTTNGTTTYTINNTSTTTDSSSSSAFGSVAGFCFSLLSYLLFTLIFAAVCPKFFRTLHEKTSEKYGFSRGIIDFLIGLAVTILVPVVLIFALLTIIGIPVTIIAAILYALALYASSAVSGYFLGDKILNHKKETISDKRISYFLTSALGIVIFSVINLIPYLNIFTTLVILCFGVGLTVRTLFVKKK